MRYQCPSQSKVLLADSKKLDKLSQSTAQLCDESRIGFQSASNQFSKSTTQQSAELSAGFSSISSQLDNTEATSAARDSRVLISLGDVARNCEYNIERTDNIRQQQDRAIDLNEVGHQAVLSSVIAAASSNLEAHKTTQNMVRQYQGETKQLLKSHTTFGKGVKGPTSPFARKRASNSVTMGTSVYWHWGSSRLPIGTLLITFHQSRQTTTSRHFSSGIFPSSGFTANFVPPQWLSSLAIAYSIRLYYEMTSSQWRWDATLRPMTVNYDPFFIIAVKRLDVAGVDAAFASGRANPADHILLQDNLPEPWYNVGTL